MKKERLFPYWSGLERVIPGIQSQTASNIRMTLVSVEMYTQYGFLVTLLVESIAQSTMFDRLGRGWVQADISDQQGNHYKSLLTMIAGVTHKHIFSGRAVMVCMPSIVDYRGRLLINIETIEWEYLDSNETNPPSEILLGPWEFEVSL